jgi:predicted RNA-binding protein with TRAM domain
MSHGRGRSYGGSGNRGFKRFSCSKTSTSRQGDGIARVQEFVLFVKNAKAGQNVKVKV